MVEVLWRLHRHQHGRRGFDYDGLVGSGSYRLRQVQAPNNPRGSGGYGISTSERCVGNNIGVYYVPEPSGLLFFLILVGVIAVSVVVVSLRRKEKALSGR